MKRVLVCGGRDFDYPNEVDRALNVIHRLFTISVLIEGEAAGADQLARNWAQLKGIEVLPFHADWNLFGKVAGSVRNSRMLREGKPDLGVAFPGGRGTADMVRKLEAENIPVMRGRWVNFLGQETVLWR